MTTGTKSDTVPRETQALLLTPPEGGPTTPAGVDALADGQGGGPQLVAQHQYRVSLKPMDRYVEACSGRRWWRTSS